MNLRSITRFFSRASVQTDQYDRYGLTPLMHAAIDGDADRMQKLIEAGANVNAATRPAGIIFSADHAAESTPLHLAALHGNRSAAEILVRAGAEVNARNAAGETPLDLAIKMLNSAETAHARKLRASLATKFLQPSERKIVDFKTTYEGVARALVQAGAETGVYNLPDALKAAAPVAAKTPRASLGTAETAAPAASLYGDEAKPGVKGDAAAQGATLTPPAEKSAQDKPADGKPPVYYSL